MLTAALALVALPGLAGSRAPSAVEPVPAGAFQPLLGPRVRTRRSAIVDRGARRAAIVSAGFVDARRAVLRAGRRARDRPDAPRPVDQPEPGSHSSRKPPKYTLRGEATFYDNGTTAMRLPRGTVVIICGGGGCIERVVNDYGPQQPSPDRRPLPAGLLRDLRLPVVERGRRRHGLRLLTTLRLARRGILRADPSAAAP